MKMHRKVKITGNRGRDFEREILEMASRYESERRLVLRKVDPPTRVLKIKGKVCVVQCASPFLDFVGVHRDAADEYQTVMIEAKVTEKRRLVFGSGGLSDKQIENVRTWHNAGAAVGVLVKWWEEGVVRFSWVTPRDIGKAIDSGWRSVALCDCERVSATIDGLPGFIGYL